MLDYNYFENKIKNIQFLIPKTKEKIFLTFHYGIGILYKGCWEFYIFHYIGEKYFKWTFNFDRHNYENYAERFDMFLDLLEKFCKDNPNKITEALPNYEWLSKADKEYLGMVFDNTTLKFEIDGKD